MTQFLIFAVVTFICGVSGISLNDKTHIPTTEEPQMSDYHNTLLVNILMMERDARLKLEEQVSYLQKEFVETRQEMTDLYHDRSNDRGTINKFSRKMKDLDDKYEKLQNKYKSLKIDFDILRGKCDANDNKINQIELEIQPLKQLKTVVDLQTVLNNQSKTKHLEKEMTDSKINQDNDDVSTKKHNFLRLYVTTEKTVERFNSSVKKFRQSASIGASEHDHYIGTKESELKRVQMDKLRTQGTSEKETKRILEQEIYNVQQELHTQRNRVAVTAGADGKTYPSGSYVLFPHIYTIHGINGSSVSTLGSTGVFTCNRPGLYLLSVFIMTGTQSSYAYVYKNNLVIAVIYFSLNGYYQTNSVSVLEHLAVNDTIYVQVYNNMYVYFGHQSCISLLQITEY